MPINTDLNVAPYFDDYDQTKNFHRILFRPSTAIQARELTQLQSILQNQIERFGDWAFKNGDIVSGCAVIDIPVMSFVRIDDFQSDGQLFDVNDLVGMIANSATSNLQARVIAVSSGVSFNYPNTDPSYDTNKIYVKYLNSGVNQEIEYANTDQLTFYNFPLTGNSELDVIATVNVYVNSASNTYSSGNAHGVSVTDGVVYLNGNFVRVEDSTVGIVNSYGTYAANNLVGFTAIEEIINENQDDSILDNALGYPNENAPGAHRLKITPSLIALDANVASNTEGFNPIATYRFGSLITKTTSDARISGAIEEAIAKRTFEESGNYVVSQFKVDSASNLSNITSNYGANGVFARVAPGSGYASGYRVELLETTYIDMRRGVVTNSSLDQQISFNYGGSYIVNEVAGSFDFDQLQTVTFYDTIQKAVTNRVFNSINPVGTAIGTGSMRCFTYINGPAGSNSANYSIHVFNIKLNAGYSTKDIKSIYYNGTNKGVADLVEGSTRSTSSMLFGFGVSGVKNLRDDNNNINTQYTYRKKQSGVITSTGNVVITIPTSSVGGLDQLPFGIGQISDLNAARFTLTVTANVNSSALSGTITTSSSNTTVTGSSTSFLSNFIAGDQIYVGTDIRTVMSVVSNISLTVDAPFGSSGSGLTYYKRLSSGKILPISQGLAVSGLIEVTNTTSFTIDTGITLSSSATVDVVFDVLRSNVIPAKKVIKKDRFVKIDTTSNPNGPWCLGFSDIYNVKKVYVSAGEYTNSTSIIGSDATSNFNFDTGQRDDYYDLGYLYPLPGYSTKSNPYLLVQLDYFTVNTAPGTGFFTVESYPIDDNNSSNTNAIQTKDFPCYVIESGNMINLRDYIDFRPPSTSTATDTGTINTANSTQLVSAIALASVNPSDTVTFSVPVTGLNVPAYGQTLQSDVTYYLPRKDLIYITKDNLTKVKEGVSRLVPQTPFCPESAMSIAVIDIPSYPSLSSDQLDTLTEVNKRSKSLIRDSRYFISSTITTNRGYTMKDIGGFDERIKNLEYYTQLSLLEKKAKDMTVTDANGLDRFKNGIFVENFSDYSAMEVSNPGFNIAIDIDDAIARPKFVKQIIKIDFKTSGSTATKTGRAITLPYSETSFLVQPYATKYRNSALVAFSWNGKLVLVPPYDNHGDTVNAGSINITVDTSTPWEKFANSPLGTTWGEWRTTTSIKALYVGNPYWEGLVGNHGQDGASLAQQQAMNEAYIRNNIWSYLKRVGYTEDNYILGNLSLNYMGEGTPWSNFGIDPNDVLAADAKSLGLPPFNK